MSDSFELPKAIEAERQVISAILKNGRETFKRIDHLLTKDDFFDKDNAIIYRAARALWQKDGDADLVTITDFLRRKGYLDNIGGDKGGTEYLIDISNDFISSVGTVQYAKMVADRAVARRIISKSSEIITMASKADDMDEFVNEAEKLLKGVTRTSARKQSRLSIVDLEEWRQVARDSVGTDSKLRGMSLGYENLDALTEGLEAGEVMILTGHTKHGKSKLAANIAWNVAEAGGNVMFINTEMTKLQVARRMNGMDHQNNPTRGHIYLNDRADLEYKDAIAIMERAKEMGCDLVIVDHLHFFSRSVENQVNELSKITKEFKEAAVQLDIPLILLCHLQQGDTSKRPSLQTLKGSSSIAQDADIVITVWRDDRPHALDGDTTEVIRLAHRSAERAVTKITMYAEGIRLVEQEVPKKKTFVDGIVKVQGEVVKDVDKDGRNAADLQPDW